MKLENMRADLDAERAQLEARGFDAELQGAAADITATAESLRSATQKVAELRRERDRLSATTQAATRLRVAQENAADLDAQVCLLWGGFYAMAHHAAICWNPLLHVVY